MRNAIDTRRAAQFFQYFGFGDNTLVVRVGQRDFERYVAFARMDNAKNASGRATAQLSTNEQITA